MESSTRSCLTQSQDGQPPNRASVRCGVGSRQHRHNRFIQQCNSSGTSRDRQPGTYKVSCVMAFWQISTPQIFVGGFVLWLCFWPKCSVRTDYDACLRFAASPCCASCCTMGAFTSIFPRTLLLLFDMVTKGMVMVPKRWRFHLHLPSYSSALVSPWLC